MIHEESLRHRLMEYLQRKPLRCWGTYYAHNMLTRVDGLADIKEVQDSITRFFDGINPSIKQW